MKRCALVFFLLLSLLLAGAVSAGAEPLAYRDQAALWAGYATNPEPIVLQGDAYSASEMEQLFTLDDGVLYTGESGWVEYTVTVPEAALYSIQIRYFPGEGHGGSMQRKLTINGELPFAEASEFVFSRAWNDASRDYKLVEVNQPIPSQVETPEWMTVYLEDSMGYTADPFVFALEAGENTLRIESLREDMMIGTITLGPPRVLPTYAEYLEGLLAEGISYADAGPVKIQAEDAALKSSPSFYPINERTSPLTEPYHSSYIVLNSIGATSWKDPGQWIAWDVDVPADGLYRIAFRFKQSEMRGLYATRQVSVNGEVPFKEASDLRFYFSTNFQFEPLGQSRLDPRRADATREEYWFYLHEGTNRIELRVALGALGDILLDMEECINSLNALYREIVSITGTAPDQYRDYQLFARIPHLRSVLTQQREVVQDLYDRLTGLTGSGSERTAGFTRLLSVIDDMLAGDSAVVVKRLTSYKESVTSIGKSTLDLKDQPLRLDYLIVAGKDMPDVQAEGSFLQKAGHTISSFVGSFFNDYNVINSQLETEQQEIDVWLSTGRDQFEVIRRLINESFETETGIKVNLKLITADALLPSTMTGIGPDIAIQIGNSAPVNFAYRDAAYDLSQFDDFDEVLQDFLPAAMDSFYYNGGCYALPDQMSFLVMYYRTDILNSLGLEVPKTWSDLLSLIPYLQRNNMEIYLETAALSTLGSAISIGSSKAINPVFLSMLYQLGGDIYSEDGSYCDFDSEAGNVAFRKWTEFYTQHGFPREIDFVTRFRIGEVPIGVVDLSTYTRLSVSAPEIRGDWSIGPVPGTLQEDGSITYGTPCVTGAAMMIRNMVEKNGTQDEAWTFLKWWCGEETQIKYAREMEAILGPAGRYPVASLGAFDTISWPRDIKDVLDSMLGTLHGIEQVPGGYITGRYLDNAFVTVITDYESPADILYEYTEMINEEIAKKRTEFGLETTVEGE